MKAKVSSKKINEIIADAITNGEIEGYRKLEIAKFISPLFNYTLVGSDCEDIGAS